MTTRARARARLTASSAVLLVGAVTAACGGEGNGAPSDASEKEFCETQTSLIADLIPEDMTNPEVPTDREMAQAVKDWGRDLEQVGTPQDIPDDARAGFEALVEQAAAIDAADFSIEKLEELEAGGADASAEARKQADAFSDYLTKTCGDPLEDLELPQMPELSGSTE